MRGRMRREGMGGWVEAVLAVENAGGEESGMSTGEEECEREKEWREWVW